MVFIQRIHSSGHGQCTGHGHNPDDCTVIDCITTEPVTHRETGDVIHPAGAVVWWSHLHSDIHPAHRLNPDHPAQDHRGDSPVEIAATDWCDPCRDHWAYKALMLNR